MDPARTPLVVANWRSGPARTEVPALVQRLVQALAPLSGQGVELVVCPPFPWLGIVADLVAEAGIAVGAQTMATIDVGDVTGEVPARLLRGLCRYVLLGHYERRILCGERDGEIRKQVQAAFVDSIHPIVCVGESADALEEGAGPAVVVEQLEPALEELSLDSRLVVAYAPSWTTIGRVSTPGADYANNVCGIIRSTLASIASPGLAAGTRIIYGGRLSEASIADLARQPEIDGVLVGSGATNVELFAALAGAVARAQSA